MVTCPAQSPLQGLVSLHETPRVAKRNMQCSVASNPGLAQPNTDQMSLSSSNSTDDAERTASISEASDCLIANETKLVNEFIRIADAGNANQEGDRGKIVDQLILSAWHLTSFVPTPNFADQQVRTASCYVFGSFANLPPATHTARTPCLLAACRSGDYSSTWFQC